MSKKPERKNRTNLVVKWPTTPYFTIKELLKVNSDFKEITLRVRLTKFIETNEVVEIGNKSGAQGRPEKVFAKTPVSDSILKEADSNHIVLKDRSKIQKQLTNVVTNVVSNSIPSTVTTV